MTTQLKVIGREHIGKIEFTGIEGGFGKDKKAMLVKDIAKIHDQHVGNINRIINNNRKWFEDGIDVIDLKSNKQFAMLLTQSGFTQNMHIEVNRPDPDQLLTVPQFKQELSKLGIVKRLDWIRNDMFVQLPELKDYVFNRNAGPGHHMKISRKAIDVIKQHRDEIDWRG